MERWKQTWHIISTYCSSNDDITVNFKPVLECLSRDLDSLNYGTIAGDKERIATEGLNVNDDGDTIELTRDHSGRFFGFGCFFMVQKELYHQHTKKVQIFLGRRLVVLYLWNIYANESLTFLKT